MRLPSITYIVTSRDDHQAVAFDPKDFERLLFSTTNDARFTDVYLFARTSVNESFGNTPINDLAGVYAMNPLLKVLYAKIDIRICFDVVPRVLTDSPHSNDFIMALSQYRVSNNLVNSAQTSELYTAFSRHWQVAKGEVDDQTNTTRHLLPDHQEQIWQAVEKLGLEDTNKNRAAVMLVLSSMFTRYSSSHFFGTEMDSPPAVRLYASALLNEACRLDPALIDENKAKDWQSRLLGIGNAFTCTAILSREIDSYIKYCAQPNSPLEHVSVRLYPVAWR